MGRVRPLWLTRGFCPSLPLGSDGQFFLTDFDGSSCSCGPCHQYGDYFSADRSRFGCGTSLNVCASGTCVKLVVTDYGPVQQRETEKELHRVLTAPV